MWPPGQIFLRCFISRKNNLMRSDKRRTALLYSIFLVSENLMSQTFKKTVFLGLSGGVDSAVALSCLLNEGYRVVPVFLKWWEAEAAPTVVGASLATDCPWREDQEAALAVAKHFGLEKEFRTWNFSREFFEYVLEPFIEDAKEGRTGNPDVGCNRVVKFGAFLKAALAEGADFVATGHYARVVRHTSAWNNAKPDAKQRGNVSVVPRNYPRGSAILQRAKCAAKNDQTYFLWQLTQEQLARSLFPIGELGTKEDVREEARRLGLLVADRKATVGICGIDKRNYGGGYAEFLKQYIPVEEGDIVTTAGKVVGKHQGLSFITYGQRQHLGQMTKADGGPFYAVKKDFQKNVLVVASPADAQQLLYSDEVFIGDVNWISGVEPKFPLQCEAFVRHPQDSTVRCTVAQISANGKANTHESVGGNSLSDLRIFVRFEEPQWALTPGQSVVFYQGDVVLGGGVMQ